MAGKVYLVGAGPGDPGLLTIKGKRVLERADCILIDSLANEELLAWAQPEVEIILLHQRDGTARSSQEEINKLLIERARAGKTVVRLKGGDPFIFGRGGEEAEALAKAGIAFEVVPGISAGSAAPAYAGIPVTHREFASAVCFLTGHEDPAKHPASLDWSKLGGPGATLVFFMGVRNLASIVDQLLHHGFDPNTSVAAIHWGTRPEQSVVTGTVANIVSKASAMSPPAVLVVGEVVKLREQLNWFERLPLFGRRIAITRAREQADTLRQALAELGARAVVVPTIEIRPPASWDALDGAIKRLEEFDYLLVTSVNGARYFLARLLACGRDARHLRGLKIGAIGPATASELAKSGIQADFVPRQYRAEGLMEVLAGHELHGKAFLIPRAKIARDLVPRALAERGARVEIITVYEAVLPEFQPGELERLLAPSPDLITFTSSSTATNFVALMREHKLEKVLTHIECASIGPVTSEMLRKLGLKVAVEASESTIPGLVRAIQEYFSPSRL